MKQINAFNYINSECKHQPSDMQVLTSAITLQTVSIIKL